MTLQKQLFMLVLFTATTIYACSLWISVQNTRDYLNQQLATQTQNTVKMLGMSLAPHMQPIDIATIDTRVNAVFDSGYYQSLKLENINGKVLIERTNTTQIDEVPVWFIDLLPLTLTPAESLITTGWNQAGNLYLQAHPGFAYKELWQTSQWLTIVATLIFISALLLARGLLKLILKPLHDVEEQAKAISANMFKVVEHIPGTRELRRVVLAMNGMSEKLRVYVENLSERAEHLRKIAHFDELSGLLNRRGFTSQLTSIMRDRETGGFGAVALIRARDIEAYSESVGHRAADDLLRDIARLIGNAGNAPSNMAAARIRRADFAVLLPLADSATAEQFAVNFNSKLDMLGENMQRMEPAHIGITMFTADDDISAILAAADTALAEAMQQGGGNHVQPRMGGNADESIGEQAWEETIRSAIDHNRIQLVSQPVIALDGSATYREVLMRIRDEEDQPISPASFVAMADRLGLSSDLDRHITRHIVSKLQSGVAQAINLSPASVASRDFALWLDDRLKLAAGLASELLFEISEHALTQDADATQQLIKTIRKHGSRVVMERFGTRLSSFKLLSELRPDYIKLDGSHIRDINSDSDNSFFLHTVCDLAHGLDIGVIAEQVETEAELKALTEIGINAMQGYYFGKPEPLPEKDI